jgi:hypothetical protein
MSQPDNGNRVRIQDTVRYKVKDNWWWVLPIVLPICYALVTDHFTLNALAGEVVRLEARVEKQIEKAYERQKEIALELREQAETNGAISAKQDALAQQISRLESLVIRAIQASVTNAPVQ